MFFLGFEGLILATLAAMAAAKISHDVVTAEAERDAALRPVGSSPTYPRQPAGQLYCAAQRADYDPIQVRLEQQANGCFHARCVPMISLP